MPRPPAVAFCIDDKAVYLMLLRVAVRSLRHVCGANAPYIVCVYAGNDPEIIRGVEAENICLARYTPVIDPESLPPNCRRAAGCFLKLELALVPELAEYETVLYCDTDVMFLHAPNELFALRPPYMAMTREQTTPFFHEHESLSYTWRGNSYTVRMPFPIWTFNSGSVVFNLARLRQHDYIHNFLAFSAQNAGRIGNLDQSLLNYFFGKRITQIDERWNYPPYKGRTMERASIVHFHGPKPWDVNLPYFKDLRINDFELMRAQWKTWLRPEEAALVAEWEAAN